MTSALDLGVLCAYATCHADEIAAMNDVRRNGYMLTGPRGRRYLNPMVRIASSARRDKVRYSVELGLTPSSRTRVAVLASLDDRGSDEFLDD